MSIRSMLVPLTSDSERQSAALEAAIALAGKLQAHLDVVYLRDSPATAFQSLPTYRANGGDVASAYERIKRQITDQCESVHQSFDVLCKRHGVPAADTPTEATGPVAVWTAMEKDIPKSLAWYGRAADLVVVGRPNPKDERNLLEACLRSTGRPVMLVPAWHGSVPGRRIAIAWNGGLEAARAMTAALPFLVDAETVTILTAESERTAAAAADNAKVYLARHGIRAETQVFSKNANPPVGKALLDYCRQYDADMLVMGAYSHSRAHELLLGGVTSYMSSRADRPIFMVH